MSHKTLYRFASLMLALVITFAGYSPALAAPPTNDNFAGAEVISSLPFSTTIDITEAGIEPNEPQSCSVTDRTAWYSFTPAETMSVRITRGGSTTFSNVSIFSTTGSGIEDLSLMWCPLYNPAPITLEAHQTYYIQAGAYPGEVGTIQINMEKLFPSDNDDFINADVIVSLPVSISVDVTDAWNEAGEVGNCGSMERTVWYSFTPTENMLISAESHMSGNVNLYLSSGSEISDLSFLGCTNSGSFNFPVEAEQTYYLQVGFGGYGQVGTVQFNLRQIFPPANDNFAKAEIITSLPFNAAVDISDATTEPNEQQWCYPMDRTVWYSFTSTETIAVQADAQGSIIGGALNIYRAIGSGLDIMSCTAIYGPFTFIAEANQTYYIQAGALDGEIGSVQINLDEVPSPPGDDFVDAISVSTLPLAIDFNNTVASFETSEPVPSCAYTSPPYSTVWFAFTASQTETVSASVINYNFSPFWAVYSGSSLNNITELGCRYFDRLSFQAIAGHTYYIQVGGLNGSHGSGALSLEVTPLPEANFGYYPGDPSRFDTIQYYDGSNDPGNMGFQTYGWNFGDGAVASGYSAEHKYAKDGDYQVTHTVTTVDGRTASVTQTVQIRTHDVAITKITTPNSANVGQTKAITVNLRNIAYPETVQIDLYKSTSTGFVWVATLTKSVPVLSGNRTTAFDFNYKFTSDDAKVGKVTFKAVASVIGTRDAWPSDNEIFSLQTKVAK